MPFHLHIDETSKGYIRYNIAQGNHPNKMSNLNLNQTQMTTIDLNSTILLKLSVNKCILSVWQILLNVFYPCRKKITHSLRRYTQKIIWSMTIYNTWINLIVHAVFSWKFSGNSYAIYMGNITKKILLLLVIVWILFVAAEGRIKCFLFIKLYNTDLRVKVQICFISTCMEKHTCLYACLETGRITR